MTKRSFTFLACLLMALGITTLPALAQQWTLLTDEAHGVAKQSLGRLIQPPLSPASRRIDVPERKHLPQNVRNPDGSLVSCPPVCANYSGYVVTGATGSVTKVAGSWTVPAVACTLEKDYSSFWVGIDGFPVPTTIEQIGTDSTCAPRPETNCVQAPCYYAWYEFFPGPTKYLSLPITPGDQVSATVQYLPSTKEFIVKLKDETTGASSRTIPSPPGFSGQLTSAEWIAEAPSGVVSGTLPLADFGRVNFTAQNKATVAGVSGPIGSFPSASMITMVSNGTAQVDYGTKQAIPSPLSSTNQSSFADKLTCAAPPSGMVGWWPGDGDTNDIIAGNNGTPFGGVTFMPTSTGCLTGSEPGCCEAGTTGCGMVGQAFSFGGADYIEVPSTPALEPQKVSVAAWLNASSVGQYSYALDSVSAMPLCDASYALYTGASGGLFFYICTTDVQDILSPDAGTGIWDGKFHFVVGTFGGHSVKLYVDGAEVGNGTPTNGSIAYGVGGPQSVFIGTPFAGATGNLLWQGMIDEVQIFNRALTAKEVLRIYNAGPAGECK